MKSNRPAPSRTSSTSIILIAFFALASLGTGGLAWKQYQELIDFRATRITASELEKEKKRAFAAEQELKKLQAELAALKANPPAQNVQVARGNPPAARGGRGGDQAAGNPRGGGEAQQVARGGRGQTTPEMQRAIQAQQRAQVEIQYAGFFNSSGLPPEQADQVKTLMADRANMLQDLQAAATAQGQQLTPDLVAAAQQEFETNLANTMGAEAYAQYQAYNSTLNQRQQVAQLQAAATMAGVPMDAAQTEQLIQLLAQNSTRTARGGAAPTVVAFGGRGGGGMMNTTQVNISAQDLAAIQGVLTPAQLQVVNSVQQAQAATQQAGRAGAAGGRGGGGGGGGRGGRGGG